MTMGRSPSGMGRGGTSPGARSGRSLHPDTKRVASTAMERARFATGRRGLAMGRPPRLPGYLPQTIVRLREATRMHDLVIRNGTVVDGTGAPRRHADVAIDSGRITTVGVVTDDARDVIDATDKIVTPGFVDIHTHYDGQVLWDPTLSPSSWHGVTTLIMGSCGVGFAPVEPGDRPWLVGLMEGVEEIPSSAINKGVHWAWQTFPEYLDVVDSTPKSLDVGAQVPHGPLRAYAMGGRGRSNEPATPEEIDLMAAMVTEAVQAGALGVTTSRTVLHRGIDGVPVPGTFAGEDELFALG